MSEQTVPDIYEWIEAMRDRYEAIAEVEADLIKVYTCIDHEGHWPVGVASVVVAEDEGQARILLDAELVEQGLLAKESYTLQEMDLGQAQVVILADGDY